MNMRRLPNSAFLFLVAISLTGIAQADPGRDATRRPDSDHQNATRLSYRLANGHEHWPADKRERIVAAMDAAVALYNEHGTFNKHVTANYNPGTPTAEANYDGWISFGGQISLRVAMHEIAHTLGVGTHPQWRKMLQDRVWTGEYANALLREFDGTDAILRGDRMHFWPYGLNYDREGGTENKIRHVRIVEALRKDMGISNDE